MRAVEKNTFYKQTTINQSIAVRPNFSDLADGGTDTTMILEGGVNPAYYLMSGAVAKTPAYGESELVGGFLQLYTEGVTMPLVPSLPQLLLYRTKPGTQINEGSMKTSFISGSEVAATRVPTGQDIAVYRSVVSADNYYAIENFDGGDKKLGRVKMLESIGNGTMSLGEAYLPLSKASATAHSLGNIGGNRRLFALKKYFSNFFVDGAREVPIEPEGSDSEGVWRPQIDKRQGSAYGVAKTTTWKKPYWKYNRIKDKIKFKSQTAVSSDMESVPLASRGNTIFDEVYATSDMNNPFTSDVNNPLMMTSCELSTAKKYSGGQAFRMYHLWDFSSQNAQLQLAMGGRALTPSMTRASIFNLPRPHLGLDNADALVGGEGHLGWTSTAAPKIEMRMNVSKLGYNPFLSSLVNAVPVASTPHGYRSYTGLYDGTTTIPDTDTLTGFFRCVAVTWSNYKPKTEHTTLDKFLEYGLSRFYGSTTINTEHVVGGVVFTKTPIDVGIAGGDPGIMGVFPIPVAPYSSAKAGSTLQTQGMAKLGGTNEIVDTMQLASDFMDLRNDPYADPTPGNVGPRMVKLPQDSWFNMTAYIDPYAKNSLASSQQNIYNYTTTNLEGKGAAMRVYFETEIDTSGTTETTALQNIPFIDVPFPASTGSTGSANKSSEYSFNDDPAMYPKHMTIWVQNYRWISGSADTATGDQDFNNSYDVFAWGDDDAGLKEGAAIEAELFIDDIKLSNWTPEVINCSIGASIASQQYFNFGSEGQISPFQAYGNGGHYIRAWALSGQAISGNMQEKIMPEQMVFGFENPAQFPNKTNYANDCYGYILGNGFNTRLFGSLNRVPVGGAAYAFTSISGGNINQKKLGGQYFGSHYWLNSAETTAVYSGTTLSGSVINFSYDSDSITTGLYNTGSVNLGTGSTWDFPSTDGFTQKGLFRVAMSGAGFNNTNTWTKRENISVATKITGIMGASGIGDALNANQIKVASTNIFNQYSDDEYIIFRIGKDMPHGVVSGNANTLGWGVGADEATAWPNVTQEDRNVLKLAANESINQADSIVTLSLWRDDSASDSWLADDGTTELFSEDNLSDLWIGPKKYWLTLQWPSTQTQRTYQNFCVVQNVTSTGTGNAEPTAAAMTGTTWAEGIFSFDSALRTTLGSAGLYLRPWNLSTDPQDSTLIMNEDYGFGAYDDETDQGGEVSQATSLIDNWVEMDMMGLAKKATQDESITFLLGLANESSAQTVTISSDENSSNGQRPVMYWEYKDTLPSLTAPLKIQPNFPILSGSGADKVDLYSLDREELNAVKFTWEEEGDDILYRLLYIDTNPIQDKYDGIYFHAPINEIPGTESTATGSYYTASNRSGTAFAAATLRHITGSAGWAYAGTGTNYGPYTAAGWESPWWGATEATFIAHCIPNETGSSTVTNYIMSDYYSSWGSMNIKITKGTGVNADVTPVFTLVSGATAYGGKEYVLTSDYSFRNDGEHPLFIVVTFDATLPSDNLKMYVNGMLVKKSAGNWVQNRAIYDGTGYSASGRFIVGQKEFGGSSGYFWNGTIQELIVHKKALHVPTEPNEYILPTTYLPDMSSGTEIKYNARLFLFDYHNIIGSSNDTVCSSNEVSWEATGI